MSSKLRAERVAELVKQEIAKLLTDGLKDPRIGFVSVLGVRMSKDLRYANVYVSIFGDDKARKDSLIGLQRSAGWVRREVGHHLKLRYTPELRFFADDSLDQVYHLEEVIHQIHEEQAAAPMRAATLAEIAEELRAADSFLLTSHVSPDGDAVGSLLGVYHLLRAMGKKQIACALSDPVPQVYKTLPSAGVIVGADGTPPKFEVAVVIDVAQLDRIGAVRDWIPEGAKVIVLDHHLEVDPDGTLGFVDPGYAAAGEIILELFDAAGVPLSLEAAHCLYVAQATDTGCFRYSNTNPRSHHLAARLHECGIDTGAICTEVFDVIPRPKIALLRRMLDRLEFAAGGLAAYSYLTKQDLDETGAGKEDMNGLVNYARNVEGVRVGVLFNGVEPQLTKVSLRSTPQFNSAAFLGEFGGGGHAAAAGATVERPLNELMPELIARLAASLGEST